QSAHSKPQTTRTSPSPPWALRRRLTLWPNFCSSPAPRVTMTAGLQPCSNHGGSIVHITTICPGCQAHYQVDPSLRGRKMRCPNPSCRTVFEVQDTDTAFDRNKVVIAS